MQYPYAHRKLDPDHLLRQIEDQKAQARRGRLKIFFGSCPGVGKTYAMLLAAHEKIKEGVDVAIGIVETHNRPETEMLVSDLPQIPFLNVDHRGIQLRELDLNAAKLRKPHILLVDELAHSNTGSMRHPKRWSDVEELLDAGINVYTTLNVQHLESLSDVVAGTTGVWVKETVPDAIFDTAEDIILVDINVDELLKRLREGKVYVNPQAKAKATENFFKARNLIALREIALRRTAERVDAQMHDLLPWQDERDVFPVADRIMVCIGPDPLSVQLVRTAKRTATSLKAPWTAVYVENLRHYSLKRVGKDTIQRLTRMAERMGGKSFVIQGDSIVDDIIDYARTNRITKIIVGKTIKPMWKTIVFGSLADKIIRKSGNIDVYVVSGKASSEAKQNQLNELTLVKPGFYIKAFLVTAFLTAFGFSLGDYITPIDQALIYVMGVVLVAARLGRGPSILYSLLSVTAFNFFFIPPRFTFDVYDRSYWLSFIVMLMTSFVITSQASRLRLQAVFSRDRERETQSFYSLTRELASVRERQVMSDVAVKHISEMFGVTSLVGMADEAGHIVWMSGTQPHGDRVKEDSVVQWCFDNGQVAGRHTTTMPSASGLYFPLVASSGTQGVLGVVSADGDRVFTSDEMTALETCSRLLASALDRAMTADAAQQSKIEIESEKLRTMLLSSVSHDLRTPLASITGAASTIATDVDILSHDTIRDLGRSINKEAERLSHLVSNLLEVTRLESGHVELNLQPYFIEELIGSALARVEHLLLHHEVVPRTSEGLPMVLADGILIEQVLINLLENAARYTPAGSRIDISAISERGKLIVSIADNGSGISPGYERRVFDKFYSISQRDVQKGTGLGLAICASILKVHKGDIWVERSEEGGCKFLFALPVASPLGLLSGGSDASS